MSKKSAAQARAYSPAPATNKQADDVIVAPDAPDAPVEVQIRTVASPVVPEAPVPEAPVPAKAAVPTKTVKFVSRRAGFDLKLGLGAGDTVRFDERGEVEVSEDVAQRMRAHLLYERGHFMEARSVMRAGDNKLVAVSEEDHALVAAGKSIFYFPERANFEIRLIGHEVDTIPFVNHRAVVAGEVADALRKHTFFVQGRLQELK